MAQLIFKTSSAPMENVQLTRLRTTIGRSARSDLCIPDAFASRLHAEVRQEGDSYWLQDLGSANGTRYNGMAVKNPVPISSGGEIQIGGRSQRALLARARTRRAALEDRHGNADTHRVCGGLG